MKFTAKVATGMALAASMVAGQAEAQVNVSGTALGCFFTAGGTCTPTATATAFGGALAFNGSTFNDVTVAGFTGFGGNPVAAPGANFNNFGAVTVGTGAFTPAAGSGFILQINFANPAMGSMTTNATLIGGISATGQGAVFFDFANNNQQVVPGGAEFNLRLQLNDLTVDAGQTGAFNGTVFATQAVIPEPSTYALMATGLLGLFGAARARRRA
jgi:hypothetical protein